MSTPTTRQVSLSKGNQTFVFTYEPGDEALLMEHLHELANRHEGVDQFDVLAIGYQVGKRMARDFRPDRNN